MRAAALGLLALHAAACGGGDAVSRDGAAESAAVIDSVLPMDVMIERFQSGTPRQPTGLDEAASTSRDELVERFARAVESADAEALRSLRLDVSEWAWLYFPTSHFAAEPYRQPPATGWLLTEQNGRKGEVRLLRRYGGRPLDIVRYDCESAPVRQGLNQLWYGCVVRLAGDERPRRLFGTILERDGRFAFVSMSNDL